MNEYRIIALQRSGHHGIIWWLLEHFDIVNYKNRIGHQVKHDRFNDYSLCLIPRDRLNLSHLNVRISDNTDTIVYNFENQFSDLNFGSKKIYNVYVIRNIFNSVASMISPSYQNVVLNEEYFEQYISFYRRAIQDNYLIVRYDQWLIDQEYRKEIAKALNLKFTDRGFKKPSTKSSFSQDNYDKELLQLQNNEPLYRWKYYRENPEFIEYLNKYSEAVNVTLETFVIDEELRKFLIDKILQT